MTQPPPEAQLPDGPSTVGAADAAAPGGAVDGPDLDPGLPLIALDGALSPLRRVMAYAAVDPARVRYLEANARRWLDPLLVLDLPAPLRELLVAAAGQVAGVDALDAEPRRARIERLRQLLTRLDAVLGLPLPRGERAPRRPPRPPRAPRAEAQPARQPGERGQAARQPDSAEGEGEPRATGRRPSQRPPRAQPAPPPDEARADDELDLDLDLDAVLEIDEDEDEDDPPPTRRGRWTGNPHTRLGSVDLDGLTGADTLLAALEAAGIGTVGQLLARAPVDEELLRPIHGAGRDLPEGRVAVGGRLAMAWTVLQPDGGRRLEATLHGAGPVRLAWGPGSTASWWLDVVRRGDRAVVAGTWDGQAVREPALVFDDGNAVRLPRYGLDGVDDSRLQALLFRLLPGVAGMRDPVPANLRRRHLGLPDAVLALHGRGDREAGRARLAFDEALGVALGTGWARLGAQKVRGISHAVVHGKVGRLLQLLDAPLADEAERAFDDIRRDLRRSRPMRRVLTGGPGGGKGLIGLLSAVVVAEGKCQVLWVSSDARMADVRFAHMEPLLREVGLSARLLSDAPNAGARDALRRGDVQVVFGTDALLALPEALEFRRLGLVISSERARLGAVSAAVDELKAPRPDLLVIPASPPSAELLMGAWATHDISEVPGAPAPEVAVKHSSQRDAAYAPARHAIGSGGQAAVLFPQIGGADALDPTEARRVVDALSADALAGASAALLHGAMTREERGRLYRDLAHRRQDVVVATIPLEDGPPIPGLAVAVVEHAHAMEPLRLARLAGLGVGQVILVVADDTPDARADELAAVVRGQRPVPGPAEPGPPLPRFQYVDLQRDGALILEARAAALDVLTADPGLRSGQHADLLRGVHARWAGWVDEPCPLPDPGEAAPARRRRKRRRRR